MRKTMAAERRKTYADSTENPHRYPAKQRTIGR